MSNKSSKILLAEDDISVLDVVLAFVSGKPIEIIYAPNGQQACELALIEKPDLILMDWEMPILSGMEALKKLSNETLTKEIPIIVISGVMKEISSLEQALESGAVDFLRKPLDKREFLARIQAALRLKEQHETIKSLLEAEKELIETNLHRSERELSAAALLDFQKNELLKKLLTLIDRINTVTNQKFKSDFKEIELELKNQLNLDRSWNQFKMNFESVHPNFFNKLNQRNSSLTRNDFKLCTYIKIGLGNKEIANLTNVEPGSIDRALNRLKKKMNVSKEQNIRDFLINYR